MKTPLFLLRFAAFILLLFMGFKLLRFYWKKTSACRRELADFYASYHLS